MRPNGEPHNHPLQRTGAAGKLNRVRMFLGRGPGRWTGFTLAARRNGRLAQEDSDEYRG